MENQSGDFSQLDGFTYPRLRLNDHTLDENLPPLISSLPRDTLCKSPMRDLGELDLLPLELTQALLYTLDLRSLADFRRVNRRAKAITDSIPQVKIVNRHAPNALRGILSINRGRWIDCDTLYNKICTAQCENCGDFGGYLYILTCKRVCFLCLSQSPKYLPLSKTEVMRKFGIKNSNIKALPCMKSIPGIYSPNQLKCLKALSLFDYESAYEAGVAYFGSPSAMGQFVAREAAQKSLNYQRRVSRALARDTSARRPLRRPRTEDPFDGQSGNPLRFIAIVGAPYVDATSLEQHWGFYCEGCRDRSHGWPQNFRRRFDENSFKNHIKQCGTIKDGRHCQ